MLAPVRSRWPGCRGGPPTDLLWVPSCSGAPATIVHTTDDRWGAQRVLRVLLLVPKRRTGWEGRKECQSWAHFLACGCGSGMIWTRSRGPMGGLGLSLRFPRVCCLPCAKLDNKKFKQTRCCSVGGHEHWLWDIYYEDLGENWPHYIGTTLYKHSIIMDIFDITYINSFPPGQDGCHLADNIFRYIFVIEKFYLLFKISQKFVPKDLVDNNPALV